MVMPSGSGATVVKNARPDGSIFMPISAGSLLLTTMTRDTGLDPLTDFEIVGQIGNLTSSIMATDMPRVCRERSPSRRHSPIATTSARALSSR